MAASGEGPGFDPTGADRLNLALARRASVRVKHGLTWIESGGASVTGRPDAVRESSETFEELYVREFGSIVALAYALSGSRAAAQDLAQEAFLAAHRNWETVGDLDARARGCVGSWRTCPYRRSGVASRKRRRSTRAAIGRQQVMPELSADDAEFWRAVRSLPRRQAQAITPITWKTDPSPRSQRSSARPMAR